MHPPIPPLASQQVLLLVTQIAALLAIGLLLGQVAVRVGMPRLVGELTAGVVLGPSLLGHVDPALYRWLFPPLAEQQHLLDAVGQIGILMFVGVAGMRLDVRMTRSRRNAALSVSVLALLVPLALGVAVGWFLPSSLSTAGTHRVTFAAFIGVAMCVTALPVIAKTLSDMNLMHRDVGQLIMTAGAVDDTIGWILLSVVSAMATVGVRAGEVSRTVLYVLAFLIVLVVVGRPLFRWVLRTVSRDGTTAASNCAAVVLILIGAAVTQALHMEAVFGAFAVGVVIGSPGVADVKHFGALHNIVQSVFAPIFLATAGLRMDLTVLRHSRVLAAAGVVLAAAIVGKFVGAYVGARIGRVTPWESLAIGAGMNARGVVEIVVALVGLRLGVLNVSSFTVIGLMAVVTSLMAPPLLRLAMSRITEQDNERLRRAEHEAWPVPGLSEADPSEVELRA